MSYYLFLDDYRKPWQVTWVKLPTPAEWITVLSYKQFINKVTELGLPKFVTFDHDLADEHYHNGIDPGDYKEKTGLDCAKWLAEYCMDNKLPFPDFEVHSFNPVGAENIRKYIDSFNTHRPY